MTFEELVTQVAKKRNTTKQLAGDIIRDALQLSAEAALKDNSAPRWHGIGRLVKKTVRSAGRKPDGTQWSKPGRVKLGLVTDRVIEPGAATAA